VPGLFPRLPFRRKVKIYFAPQLQFELNRWQSQTIHLETATKPISRRKVKPNVTPELLI
jgi:hypothetical protein